MGKASIFKRGWKISKLRSLISRGKLDLGAGSCGKGLVLGVSRDRGSGTVERNEAVRKCQTAGKRAAKRAKVRGHSPQEAPRTSGKVSRSERSRMRELQKRSITGEEKSPKCRECRQGRWQLSQPTGTLRGLDTWSSSLQGRSNPGNWAW